MLSLNAPPSLSLSHHYLHRRRRYHHHHHRLKTHVKPITAIIIPPSSSPPPPQQQQLYQPFRPPSPPAPIPPQFRSLDTVGRLDVVSNRLGLWFEYAPLIAKLLQEGFTPATLEETTGISGVEQNRLAVAAQVRHSLESSLEPEVLSFFDKGGDALLYEIRLISGRERLAAARYLVEKDLDACGAQELARAIKDFPRRRGDRGWECFDYNVPGDCLAFMYYRQSKEHKNSLDRRTAALEKALEVVETDKGKRAIVEELERKSHKADDEKEGTEDAVRVPVVRMKTGEVADATTVVVLPVCRAREGVDAVLGAPSECRNEGEFGVVVAEKEWRRWVALPGWEPLVGLTAGVVIEFRDARALPWKVNRWYKEEAILVVANRAATEVVADTGFYLVAIPSDNGSGGGGEFKVERGLTLKERGVKESLGTVVLVVRPPREENDELRDEDWE